MGQAIPTGGAVCKSQQKVTVVVVVGEPKLHKGYYLRRCDLFGEPVGDTILVIVGNVEVVEE